MLDIKFIRENPKKVKKGAKDKGYNVDKIVDQILKLDKKWKGLLIELEKLHAERNKISSEVKGKPDQKIRKRLTKIKAKIAEKKNYFRASENNIREHLILIPNMPASDVRIAQDDSKNHVVKKIGKPKKFGFKVKNHIEIGKDLELIDIERAAKVSGSRLYYLKNEAVFLEFALIRWILDILIKKGFVPVIPPVLVRMDSMIKMGYMERGEADEMYFLEKDEKVLVGTAEQSIGPMHKDEIFKEEELPKRYVGFSSCFRREAGSYGKDVKGIIRTHQFDKLEMFSYTKPKDSDKENYFFLDLEKEFTKELGLPFQVVGIVTGDLGFPAARKLDIETWIPSQKRYRETHSTSTTTDFQARGLNIRYKSKESGKAEFVHTVNGTAIAIGRILVAILENYQQKDGSVKVPEVLKKYTGFKVIKKSKK